MANDRAATASIEFFPPRTPEGVEKLRAARRQLAQLAPAFCSVTFGAGGSTREGTLATVLEIRDEGMDAAPHLSCVGGTRESIRDVLAQYRAHGIRHLVALRGDLPSGTADAGEFRYASELVAFIREETGDWFHVDVAAYPEYHPQARSPGDDLVNFKRKIDAGANSAITQYFFNRRRVLAFRRAPAPTSASTCRSSPASCRSRATPSSRASPTPAARRSRAGSGASWRATATTPPRSADSVSTWSRDLCADLLERGAPGLHFYTLNQAALTTTIWQRLGL